MHNPQTLFHTSCCRYDATLFNDLHLLATEPHKHKKSIAVNYAAIDVEQIIDTIQWNFVTKYVGFLSLLEILLFVLLLRCSVEAMCSQRQLINLIGIKSRL